MADDPDDVEKKEVGLSLHMPASEMQALKEWMHDHHVNSRSAAVRALVRYAISRGARPDIEPDGRKSRRTRPTPKEED